MSQTNASLKSSSLDFLKLFKTFVDLILKAKVDQKKNKSYKTLKVLAAQNAIKVKNVALTKPKPLESFNKNKHNRKLKLKLLNIATIQKMKSFFSSKFRGSTVFNFVARSLGQTHLSPTQVRLERLFYLVTEVSFRVQNLPKIRKNLNTKQVRNVFVHTW